MAKLWRKEELIDEAKSLISSQLRILVVELFFSLLYGRVIGGYSCRLHHRRPQ